MIDPRVRHKPESVTLLQYSNSVAEFLDRVGSLSLVDLDLDVHLHERNILYENRDFALGKSVFDDARGQRRVFSERWVREGRSWYTRSTGFVTSKMDDR